MPTAMNEISQTIGPRPGPRARLSGGDLIERVRSELNSKDGTEVLSKRAGISRNTYSLVKKLLMLSERELSQEDLATVNLGLSMVKKNSRSFNRIYLLTLDVISRNWISRTKGGVIRIDSRYAVRRSEKNRKKFENTLFAIRESCCNNHELEVPTLSSQERIEHISTLAESIAGLAELISKLKGETK